jgi:hypothetical protein
MNARITAGPAMPAPSPITTKIPVPMIAPTPIAVRCNAPTERFSSCPASCVSVRSDDTSRMAKIPGFLTFGVVTRHHLPFTSRHVHRD